MLAFLLVLIAGVSHCTRVKFMNHCGHQVHVMRQDKGHAEDEQAILGPGEEEMSEDFQGEHDMTFKEEGGMNMAEINVNGWNGMDLYSLNVVGGYSTPMMISAAGQQQVGGHTVSCRDRRCLEAYLFPTDSLKTHGVSTGGMFTLTFCP